MSTDSKTAEVPMHLPPAHEPYVLVTSHFNNEVKEVLTKRFKGQTAVWVAAPFNKGFDKAGEMKLLAPYWINAPTYGPDLQQRCCDLINLALDNLPSCDIPRVSLVLDTFAINKALDPTKSAALIGDLQAIGTPPALKMLANIQHLMAMLHRIKSTPPANVTADAWDFALLSAFGSTDFNVSNDTSFKSWLCLMGLDSHTADLLLGAHVDSEGNVVPEDHPDSTSVMHISRWLIKGMYGLRLPFALCDIVNTALVVTRSADVSHGAQMAALDKLIAALKGDQHVKASLHLPVGLVNDCEGDDVFTALILRALDPKCSTFSRRIDLMPRMANSDALIEHYHKSLPSSDPCPSLLIVTPYAKNLPAVKRMFEMVLPPMGTTNDVQ